ncbi:MAG TPA: ribokinase [Bryobacteraceae bacterium]|jgi:ribokinase
MKPAIVILGSLNMDFVVRVPHLPIPGETVLGHGFETLPGGKGANQACAAGRAGADNVAVKMLGRVGYDVFGDQLKASLAASGVDVSGVHATQEQPTGVALIWVDKAGQNSIVVASGANHAMRPEDTGAMRSALQGAAYALFQLETPLAVVEGALRIARELGVRTILDPAPAQPLTRELLSQVDILTPNESEALTLLGRAPERVDPDQAPVLAEALLALGPKAVVLKLGDQGSFYWDGHAAIRQAAFHVDAVDSTAAGDTFNGALAVALARNPEIGPALEFASAAAAISVTRAGAQASIPTLREIEYFVSRTF